MFFFQEVSEKMANETVVFAKQVVKMVQDDLGDSTKAVLEPRATMVPRVRCATLAKRRQKV
jgi:hypothetical protein